MAKRRMVTTEITSQGKFLRMSLSAQGLWLHLVANADDDGVVDAYTVMRMVGAKEDDMVLLVEREFVTILDQQEYLLWVTNWQEFNWIDPRIKEDSQHQALLLAKIPDVVLVQSTKEEANKQRTLRLKKQRDRQKSKALTGLNVPHEEHMSIAGDAPVKHRSSIVKDSIDKSSLVQSSKVQVGSVSSVAAEKSITNGSIIKAFETINPVYEDFYRNKTQQQAVTWLREKVGDEKLLRVIGHLPQVNATKYAPTITTPVELKKNMAKLSAFLQKERVAQNWSKNYDE